MRECDGTPTVGIQYNLIFPETANSLLSPFPLFSVYISPLPPSYICPYQYVATPHPLPTNGLSPGALHFGSCITLRPNSRLEATNNKKNHGLSFPPFAPQDMEKWITHSSPILNSFSTGGKILHLSMFIPPALAFLIIAGRAISCSCTVRRWHCFVRA